MARTQTKAAICRICGFLFTLFKWQQFYLCNDCRTPEKMAAAGYGLEDVQNQANVSYERARVAVFGPELGVKAS